MADTFVLEHPIEWDGSTYTQLSLREVKAKDLLAQEKAEKEGKGGFEQTIMMIAAMSGIPEEAAGELAASDLEKIAVSLEAKLGKDREDGDKPSQK